MVGVKAVAALVSIVNAVWLIYAGASWNALFGVQCHLSACGDNWTIVGLGAVLLLDSLVCIVGVSKAYYVSAAISALAVLLVGESIPQSGVQFTSAAFILTAILAIVTIVLDVIGARSRKIIAEEDHPLNLPVFG
jgi:hypothetical protein